jgi:serine/threonine protein kinase
MDWKIPHEVQAFTFKELAKATNNFAPDRKIGEGGFGSVYKGWLPDGREVAIKRRGHNSIQGIEDFQAEVTILASISHKHIVRLFGSCVRAPQEKRELLPKFGKKQNEKQSELLVVSEFTENRSLDFHLHGQPSPGQPSPVKASWKMRMEILLGVSRAIEYLQSYAERPVIHRDVKQSNILLDASWAPRLTDFGLALTWEGPDHEVSVCGTYGYAAPEYVMSGTLNQTVDVYSFGVVMLEVLTGKKAYYYEEEEWDKMRDEWKETEREVCQEEDMTEQRVEETERAKQGYLGQQSLVELAVPAIEAGKLRKVLDRRPAATPTPRQLEATELVAETAVRCVRLDWEARPSISEVVATLEAALELARCDG